MRVVVTMKSGDVSEFKFFSDCVDDISPRIGEWLRAAQLCWDDVEKIEEFTD